MSDWVQNSIEQKIRTPLRNWLSMVSYPPLLRDGKYPNDEDEQPPVLMDLGIGACLASLACTLLNISFLTVREILVTNDIKFSDIPLDVPNSYYGLENAVRDSTAQPPAPIRNPPFFAGHINQSAPSTVFFEYNRQFTDFGTVYTTDRRFLVAPGISTVLQFRVQDFGMERCNVTLSPFIYNAEPPERTTVGAVNDTLIGRVELWRLGLRTRLDPQDLSWRTRPIRSLLLASWEFTSGRRMETPEFLCESGSIMTFELACAGEDDCRIDFNQPRENFTSTLFLMQSSSL
ncbi:hypothetical protein B0H13DRAFT_2376579 [Mycena leptocephala]|nr:hypothetical protein B0H13DRAFT_2376579 [Mycena leptocephala]